MKNCNFNINIPKVLANTAFAIIFVTPLLSLFSVINPITGYRISIISYLSLTVIGGMRRIAQDEIYYAELKAWILSGLVIGFFAFFI